MDQIRQRLTKISLILRALATICLLLAVPLSSAFALECGVILPLTGSMSAIGLALKNSIELASSELDAHQQVRFIYEDSQFSPAQSVAAYHRLRASNSVGCIIIFGSSTSLAVLGADTQRTIPLLSIAITPKILNFPNAIRFYLPFEALAQKISQEVRERKLQRIAILTSETDGPVMLQEHFVKAEPARVVFSTTMVPSDTDFKSVAAKIAQRSVDAVFLNLLPPQLSAAAKQLSLLGVTNFFAGPNLGNNSEVEAAQGKLAGAWFVSLKRQKGSTFNQRYLKRFSHPGEDEGIYGYEVARLIIQNGASTKLSEDLAQATMKSSIDLPAYTVKDYQPQFDADTYQVPLH